MAANNKPITLYFVAPIYARGEHLISEKAVDDDGHPNMIRVSRGERRRVPFETAKDLIIAKQAIDWDNSKTSEKTEAEAYVRQRNKADEGALKKAQEEQEEQEESTTIRQQFEDLKKQFEALKKKAA